MERNILILAPHTDDGELGMGGTINRLIEEGHNVHYVAFSSASKSLLENYPANTLINEVGKSTQVLGIPSENLFVFDYEVRLFSYKRQEILEDIIKLKNEIKPDLIFCPTREDLHQDHIVIANESVRAFKKVDLFSYELPWNNLKFNTDMFYELDKRHIDKKIEAISKYESQSNKDYMQPEFLMSLAKVRGIQINVKYAESFEVIRKINRL